MAAPMSLAPMSPAQPSIPQGLMSPAPSTSQSAGPAVGRGTNVEGPMQQGAWLASLPGGGASDFAKAGQVPHAKPEPTIIPTSVTKYGGPISADTAESMLKLGATPDQVAQKFSMSSPGFAANYAKVQKATNNDPKATQAFLNTYLYGDANYKPPSVDEYGFSTSPIGNVLHTIYNSGIEAKNTLSRYNAGQMNGGQAGIRVASDLVHSATSPMLEAISQAGGYAYNNIPGLKGAGYSALQSPLGQQVTGAIGQATNAYNNLPQDSVLRDVGAVASATGDLAAEGGGASVLQSIGADTAVGALTNPIQTAKDLGSDIVGAVSHPIDTVNNVRAAFPAPGSAMAEAGASGVAAAGMAGKAADSGIYGTEKPPLQGVYKDFVKAGGDEAVAREIANTANPAQKNLMDAMAEKAAQGADTLGGTTEHRAIAGDQIMQNVKHVLQSRKDVGQALGSMVGSMAGTQIDATEVGMQMQARMRDLGVITDPKTGRILSIARASDAQAPILQQVADFFKPDENGRIVKTVKQMDDFRSKLFDELDLAKAKLAPTAGGQSVYSDAERIANGARQGMSQAISKLNPNYGKLSASYAELMNEPADFFKAIGYKGNLKDISTQDLRAAEVALRTLGNASAKPTEAIQKLLTVARKYGYSSNIDEMGLVKWSDALENIFPVTPTRSLAGQVSRANDAGVAATKALITGGNPVSAGILTKVDSAIGKGWEMLRGQTPENRLRLLKEMLNAPPQSNLLEGAATARSGIGGITPPESPIDTQGLVPSQGPQGGGKPGLSSPQSGGSPAPVQLPSEVPLKEMQPSPTTLPSNKGNVNSQLTPEERATGLIGGGGDNMPRNPSTELSDKSTMTPEQYMAHYPMAKFASEPGSSDIFPYTGQEKLISKTGNIDRLQGEHGSFRYIYRDDNGNIVGGLQGVEGKGKTALSNIFVDPAVRRQGIGTKLVNAAKADFPKAQVAETLTEDGTKFFTSNQSIPKSLEPLAETARQSMSAESFGKSSMTTEEMQSFRDIYNPQTPEEARKAVYDFWEKATGKKAPKLPSDTSNITVPKIKEKKIPGTNLYPSDIPF